MKIPRRCCVLCLVFLVGCSPFDVLNGLAPSSGYRRTANLAYGNLPRQKLDVYQPKNANPALSIVIFFYGGYWSYGSKNDYRFVAQALCTENFIAVLPDYRVYPSVTFPAFVQDGALAVRWVHDNAERMGGDPRHIYVMGHSAGAHIAALLTLDGDYLKAVGLDRSDIRAMAGLSGPYDFKITPRLRPIFNVHSSTQPVSSAVEPINFADGHEPPMLLIQGLKDKTVEPGNAIRLAHRITQAGGTVKLLLYPNSGHTRTVLAVAALFHWVAPTLHDVTDFFRTH